MQTNSYKMWVFSLVGSLVLFVTANFMIWELFTRDMLSFKPWYSGDLDRMGYIVGSKHYRKPESTLPKTHIENYEYLGQHVDLVTIGDSFSNARYNGKDPLYQDWIASLHNLSVMNIQSLKNTDTFSTLVTLLNSGYFEKVKPRYVIFEAVERYCIYEYAKPMDFMLRKPLQEIEAFYRTEEYRYNPPKVSFLNNGNFKFLLYSILYRFSDRAFYSYVCVRDLTTPLFSVKNGRKLLFFHEDVKHIPIVTPETIRQLNHNLNDLTKLFRKKGIRFYFMPAADKYDIYSDYILNNPYPKSVFFELLRKEPKEYVLVDTKALLQEEVKKGERDVYYADDTHWSWKASRKIAESLHFNIPSRSSTAVFAADKGDTAAR